MSPLQVKKLSENAKIPTKKNLGDAGYDLYAASEVVVKARDRALVNTDIAISVPVGTYGRIAPRSGLALKSGLDIGGGVVDYSYTGNVGVIVFNFSNEDFTVKKHDRIAQLIIEKIECIPVVEVTQLENELNPLDSRGSAGFGSTGIQ